MSSTGLAQNLRADALAAWDTERKRQEDAAAVEVEQKRESARNELEIRIFDALGIEAPGDGLVLTMYANGNNAFWIHDRLRFEVNPEGGLYVTNLETKDSSGIENLIDLGAFLAPREFADESKS